MDERATDDTICTLFYPNNASKMALQKFQSGKNQ